MFAICLESSHRRGMGHLFRMLNLARHMRAQQAPFVILVNDHPPALSILRAAQLPFEVVDLEKTAIWAADAIQRHGVKVWINDRLDTAEAEAAAVKRSGIALATFDDRGAGARLSDLHVAALAFNPAEALDGRRVLRGLDYLILNPEIALWRRQRTGASSLIVTLGGSDTYGATVKVVRLLRQHGHAATVVIGPGFEHRDELNAVLTPDFHLRIGVPSLIEEFSRHNLAVTGGGITAFEAAASGLAVIALANEGFEVPVARHLESLGAARYAGHHAALDPNAFGDLPDVARLSAAGLAHVPLHGVERVYQALRELQ